MKRRMVAFFTALILTICLTACSESSKTEDSKTNSKPESSSVTEATTTTTAATTTVPTTTTQATTTATALTSDEENEIAEAFASTPKATNCYQIDGGYFQSAKKPAISDDGSKVYFLAGKIKGSEYDGSKCVLWVYDIKLKEAKVLLELEEDIVSFAYFNDKIYVTKIAEVSGLYIGMFDKDGKKLKEFTKKDLNDNYSQLSSARVLDNGMIAIFSAQKKGLDDIFGVSLLFKSDLSSPIEVWYEGTNGNEHGIKSKEKPSGTTNRGFYYRYTDEKTKKDKLSIYDSETGKWSEYDAENTSSASTYTIYGKYIFELPKDFTTCGIDGKDSKYVIIDCESGKQCPYRINYNYKGGDYTYAYDNHGHNPGNDGEWYKCKPVNSIHSEIEYTLVSSQKIPSNYSFSGENGSNVIYLLDSNYYWFIDDYGFFLRTFEKGDSSEELVLQTKTK